MIENKTVHSMTCDFCRSEIYSGETGDDWTKSIFFYTVNIDLPALWGETAVIHLCHNCQLKMRTLFERARKGGTHHVGMLDVNSVEQEFGADRKLVSTRLECSQPDPSVRVLYDSPRHFAVYF